MKSYLLFPNNAGDLGDKIFASPYGLLRDQLRTKNIELHTYDLGDLATADKVLCFNHRPAAYAACRRAGLRPDQLVLFLMEPKPVIATQYQPSVWDKYGTVFTFLDNLVDNTKFFKMFYPQGQALMANLPGWNDRNFLTLMNANKYSYVPNELYSLRREAIRYFERAKDFDLYGFDWKRNGALTIGAAAQAFTSGRWIRYAADVAAGWHTSPRYLGTVDDKRATIAKYKFALAFENEAGTQGYITEKIFDCLFAGTVPIYRGAENITAYIPANCFIDQRDYPSFQALDQRLWAMSVDDWQSYHDAGQAFLRSPQFQPWQPANVFSAMINHL